MKKNKKGLVAFLAILTAVVGIAVAIGAYLKKKAEAIGEDLDFDTDFYDDDEFFESGSDEPLDESQESSDVQYTTETTDIGVEDEEETNK